MTLRDATVFAFVFLFGFSVRASAYESVYDRLYSQYAEYCGFSQIVKTATEGSKDVGGQGGHSAMYFRGICRDRSRGFPLLKVCEPSDPLPHEVGVSIDGDFMNVNWIAVDTRDFFFFADIRPDQDFDLNAYNRAQKQAMRMQLMQGVTIHPDLLKNKVAGQTDLDYLYQDSFATDYGINMGRNMSCARIPLNTEQLQQAVNLYNSRNHYYHDNNIPYVWDVFSNNCTHLPYDSLAQAGVWSPVGIDKPLPLSLFDLVAPENTFVDLMLRTNDLPLEEPDELFRDDAAREALLTRNWLPTQPGGLAERFLVHKPNEVFSTDLSVLLFYIPLIDPAGSERSEFLEDARYTDVKANLEHFLARYQNIQKNHPPLSYYTDQHGRPAPKVIDPAFPAFYEKYYEYIDQQIKDVTEKLARL
jgi:hypothetical protein